MRPSRSLCAWVLSPDLWLCVPLGRRRWQGWWQGLACGKEAVHAMLCAPNLPGLSPGLQSSASGLGSAPRGAGAGLWGWWQGRTSRGSCICLAQALSWALSGAEYGLKLGSQLFIKHIVESGLAAKRSSLQEGDLILKVRGPMGCTALAGDLISPSSGGLSLASVTAGHKPRVCFSRLPAKDGSLAGGSSVWCPHPVPCPQPSPGAPQPSPGSPRGFSGTISP